MCRDSTGSHLFFKPLRYRLGCHLIATLVKRLWLSYTTGLHIPATRLDVNSKESIGPLRHMCHMPYCSHLEAHSPVLI